MRVHWRIPVWKLMAWVGVLAVLLYLYIVPVARLTEFSNLARHMGTSISNLKPSDPALVGTVAWDCALGWTVTAHANICFSSEHVPTAEMYRLRDDLDRKLKGGKVDLGTLAWIWDRLALASPHGKRYVERYRPQFEACFPAAPATNPSLP